MKTLHDFKVQSINGQILDLSTLKGKKVIIVNTASECGFTPQYSALQEIYGHFKDSGLEILGFPSNDFAGQEPGTNEDIQQFCSVNYGVSFPLMSKVRVKGDDMHPVYSWLTDGKKNGVGDFEVEWNFHKFLVDGEGKLIKEIKPAVSPNDEVILNWINEDS